MEQLKSGPSFRYIAITDRFVCPESIPSRIERLSQIGVPAIQLRDKEAPDIVRYKWINDLDSISNRLFVNSRYDIAHLLNLDGIHLPEYSLPVEVIRDMLSGSMIIGKSVHTRRKVVELNSKKLDYLCFGPVFPTPSKPDLNSEQVPGLRGLEKICSITKIPVFALGGVAPDRVKKCLSAGAYGVAGIRALMKPQNPEESWQKIQSQLNQKKR